ncbi:MAG: carbohydrate porin [Nitrospirota bacterium]
MGTKFQKISTLRLLAFFIFFVAPFSVQAYDLNEKLSIEGTLTGVYQYGDFDFEGIKDSDRGSAVLDLGVNFHPADKDEFQITLSYAAGNAWNKVGPFSLSLYADDLEADLKNINGRDRDYLLEAWYKHTFALSKNASLAVTGGIIDSTTYIDDNKFANDEVAQFMNETFVNHKNVNLPSYDLGGVIELNISSFSIRALMMNTKFEAEENDFKNYDYYALQLGYTLNTSLGEGNYRIYGFTTNDKFPCWDERDEGSLYGYGISADQELSKIIGVFARFGWQNDKAVIVHDEIYSGGVNINGKLWGREKDEIGLGYAYLDGADCGDIDNTNAIEAYTKFKISDFSDVTFDVQYINDNMKHGEDRDGFIYGIRLNAYF